jgi:uncharacterized cupredoxin-like copper-binding protein
METLLRMLMAMLAVCALAQPAAADGNQTVKVTLLDMTALWSPSLGNGTSAQGMMGYGPSGPGMMGGGYGLMGKGGMMGGYGSGYGGMMGGGMMGMMSIRTDRTTVPAGKVTFDVSNLSRSIVHEILLIAVDTAEAPLPYDYNNGRIAEDQVKVVGETEEMEPNAGKAVSFDLAAGNYLLICNVPGHFAAGMVTPLTVTK